METLLFMIDTFRWLTLLLWLQEFEIHDNTVYTIIYKIIKHINS